MLPFGESHARLARRDAHREHVAAMVIQSRARAWRMLRQPPRTLDGLPLDTPRLRRVYRAALGC